MKQKSARARKASVLFLLLFFLAVLCFRRAVRRLVRTGQRHNAALRKALPDRWEQIDRIDGRLDLIRPIFVDEIKGILRRAADGLHGDLDLNAFSVLFSVVLHGITRKQYSRTRARICAKKGSVRPREKINCSNAAAPAVRRRPALRGLLKAGFRRTRPPPPGVRAQAPCRAWYKSDRTAVRA